jgi:hypothetical protein
MMKKSFLLLLILFFVSGCVNDDSSYTSSFRPSSTVEQTTYITVTKSNFSQYFSGGSLQPDNNDCTSGGCKLPSTYSFTFTKKSNFKFESNLSLSFSGSASLVIFAPNKPQSNGTGSVSGTMTMTGNRSSFSGKITIRCASAGCGSVNVRISNPNWDISSISGRIYF